MINNTENIAKLTKMIYYNNLKKFIKLSINSDMEVFTITVPSILTI